jgi:HEAT repeat protein
MLLQALSHSDERAVIGAIHRLGEAGDSRGVEPMVKLLVATTSKIVQAHARTALSAMGAPAVQPVLDRLMKEKAPQVAAQLAAVLARVSSMAALAACREVINKAEHPVARYSMALNLTASTHGDAALSIVRDYLTDNRQDERARAAVAMALGQAIKDGRVEGTPGVNTLIEIRGSASLPTPLRRATLMALGTSSQPSVVKHIYEATGDTDVQIRIAAVDALGRFTPPQVELLDRLARSTDQAIRARANQVLDAIEAAQES